MKSFQKSGLIKIVLHNQTAIMRFKTALCYQNSIAFYSVYLLDKHTYKAKLDEYSGQLAPPPLVNLQKNNQGWNSDCEDNEIVTELSAAIDFKKFD